MPSSVLRLGPNQAALQWSAIAGFSLLETLLATLIVSVAFGTFFNHQQRLQQQFRRLEWQQQAWQLAHYSLAAAQAHQGIAVEIPPLPSKQWQRSWQISATIPPCRQMRVTITGPAETSAQLTQQWCPLPITGRHAPCCDSATLYSHSIVAGGLPEIS